MVEMLVLVAAMVNAAGLELHATRYVGSPYAGSSKGYGYVM
jgi:hypothetical protein